MISAGNICPVCKKNNEPDALVCGHCGAILENIFTDSGGSTKTTNVSTPFPENAQDWSVNEAAVPKDGIAIYVEGEFHPIHTETAEEFVLGRKTGKTSQVIEDLLDLSPLGGYSRGVSRRHAAIRRTEQGYEMLDLGSVNGTWLNDGRLVPHKPYPLDSGSHLRLGSMRLFVLFHHLPKSKQKS